MNILAVDTTASICSVAVCKKDESSFTVLGEYTINAKRTHSETLLPIIESLLSSVKLSVNQIDMFALSAGPGSFTGVRIGAATIKGLAFGKDKICVGVSSLEALAYNLLSIYDSAYICPLIDARGGRYFSALFKIEDEHILRLHDDALLTLDEIKEIIISLNEPIILVGDGAKQALSSLECKNAVLASKKLQLQDACSVATVAYDIYNRTKNKDAFDDINLSCVYILPSQAEREREKRKEEK